MAPKRPKKLAKARRTKEPEGAVDTRLVKALSHPIRARALAILNERVASPNELAEQLGVPVGHLSYHVKTLYELDCVELVDEVPRRGATEHYYRGITRSFLNDDNWAALSDDAKHGVSVAGMKMINDAAKAALVAETFDSRPDRHLSCTPVVLDEQAWNETVDLLAGTLDRVMEIAGASASRQAEHPSAPVIRAVVSILNFEAAPAEGEQR